MNLRFNRLLAGLICFVSAAAGSSHAAELTVISPESEPEIAGKETDWIYGDYLMKNDRLSLVIAAPLPTRDANLTVRNIGASILDLTLNDPSNDQLSAYTPAGGRYLFHDPSLVEMGRDGDAVFWQCKSSRSVLGDGTTATVRYRLVDGSDFVETTVRIEGETAEKVKPYDGVRADRTFQFKQLGSVAHCSDEFFRQTIGFQSTLGDRAPEWKSGRPYELHYQPDHVSNAEGAIEWTVRIVPATSPLDLKMVLDHPDASPSMHAFQVVPETQAPDAFDAVTRASVTINRLDSAGDPVTLGRLQTDDQGVAHARLVSGEFAVSASAIGYAPHTSTIRTGTQGGTFPLKLTGMSGFTAEISDGQGDAIPAKATVYSVDGEHPVFGPDSTRTLVKNCVYSVHGKIHCPLDPGTYEVYFTRGPEYNRERRQVEINEKQVVGLSITLPRVVDTSGWVSTELHSHSTPSGDNTSDQFGRVENLLCEHLEFAPCTEHARVSSYMPHLEQMGLSHLMATCTGIELTGSPLPVNHQNAFPLHHHPHTQNGGGPRTDPNPEIQIERLAMWDDQSDKVVQMNHPNLHQIFGDLDVDGKPDKGFRGMFQWTDVVEVHPLQTIFEDVASQPPNIREMRIPIFQWMQLLNLGYRIPGVVNTDAHYNHHGSGWLRNWFACSTDDPAEITTEEMIRQAEAGHIVMSTGPFLSVSAVSKSSDRVAIPGDDLDASDKKVTLRVRVQCPNWLDINRVQVFVNGRPDKTQNYTRKNSQELFGNSDAVTKFDSSLNLTLDGDAHVIVAAVGEGMTMEKVMGEQYGKVPPIAVSNPIFVDVDGNGFQPNGDELGLPLPRMAEAH